MCAVAALQPHRDHGVVETWWDGSHDWCVAMEEYGLFRLRRPGVALYVRRKMERLELCPQMDDEQTQG